jgi:hypothetical protein
MRPLGASDLLTKTIWLMLSNGHDHDNDLDLTDAHLSRFSAWVYRGASVYRGQWRDWFASGGRQRLIETDVVRARLP